MFNFFKIFTKNKKNKIKKIDKDFRFMEENNFTTKVHNQIVKRISKRSEEDEKNYEIDNKIKLGYKEGLYKEEDFKGCLDGLYLQNEFSPEFNKEFKKWAREFLDGSNTNMTIMNEYSDLLLESINYGDDIEFLVDGLLSYFEGEGVEELKLYMGISLYSDYTPSDEGVYLNILW